MKEDGEIDLSNLSAAVFKEFVTRQKRTERWIFCQFVV